MATKTNKCKSCDYCKSVYVMFGCEFFRRKTYYCTIQNKPISVYDGCENLKARKTEYDLSLQRIDSVIDDIEFIFNYFNS